MDVDVFIVGGDDDADADEDDGGDDAHLEGHGGLVGGEEGVPVKLPLQLLAVLAVDKLEHRLVDHVRLRTG